MEYRQNLAGILNHVLVDNSETMPMWSKILHPSYLKISTLPP